MSLIIIKLGCPKNTVFFLKTMMEGTKPIIMEGTRPNAADYGGHPAPTGPALPNLINAVRMFKVKFKVKFKTTLVLTLKLTLTFRLHL